MHQILLAVKPRLMRDAMKRQLSESPSTVVVGEIDDELDLLLAIRATGANVVIHSWADDQMPPIYTHLLAEFPGLTLLGLLPGGEEARVCEQRISITAVQARTVNDLLTSLPTQVSAPVKVSLT